MYMSRPSNMEDFETVCKIGEGAFSMVYKVTRKSDRLQYALKKVKIAQLKEKEQENALNEIRILASIDHPSIVSYKDCFIDRTDQTLCIVMEYLAGGDLYHKIAECKKSRAFIPERLIWRYLIQLLLGLKHLHSLNIMHRDLKSANVFLSEDLSQIKLGDLNVSKVMKSRLVYTQTGTPYYASPEVWRDEPYDSKSDIWSLGCVAYEMCNRAPPFNGKKMEELFHKIQLGKFDRVCTVYSEDLNQIVTKCLEVSPLARPDCQALLDLPAISVYLRELSAGKPQVAKQQLLNTIVMPTNINDLKYMLPHSRYTQAEDHTQRKTANHEKTNERASNRQTSDSQRNKILAQNSSLIHRVSNPIKRLSSRERQMLEAQSPTQAAAPAKRASSVRTNLRQSSNDHLRPPISPYNSNAKRTPSKERETRPTNGSNHMGSVGRVSSDYSTLEYRRNRMKDILNRYDRRLNTRDTSNDRILNRSSSNKHNTSGRRNDKASPTTNSNRLLHNNVQYSHNNHMVNNTSSKKKILNINIPYNKDKEVIHRDIQPVSNHHKERDSGPRDSKTHTTIKKHPKVYSSIAHKHTDQVVSPHANIFGRHHEGNGKVRHSNDELDRITKRLDLMSHHKMHGYI